MSDSTHKTKFISMYLIVFFEKKNIYIFFFSTVNGDGEFGTGVGKGVGGGKNGSGVGCPPVDG